MRSVRRCIHEILLCVLEELEKEEKNVTELIHNCKIDVRCFRKIRKILLENELAIEKRMSGRVIYSLTDRGRTLLNYLKKVREIVKT